MMKYETVLSISEAQAKGLKAVFQEWGHDSSWWLFAEEVCNILGIDRVGEIPSPDEPWAGDEIETILACEAPSQGFVGLQARDGWGGVEVIVLQPIPAGKIKELQRLCEQWEESLLDSAPRDREGGIYPSHLPIASALYSEVGE